MHIGILLENHIRPTSKPHTVPGPINTVPEPSRKNFRYIKEYCSLEAAMASTTTRKMM